MSQEKNKICQNCGEENPWSNVFCQSCGEKLGEGQVERTMPSKDLAKCLKCGEVLSEEDQFCPTCGEKRKGKKKKPIWFFVLPIIILIGSGIFFFRGDKNEKIKKAYQETDSKKILSLAETMNIEKMDQESIGIVFFTYYQQGERNMAIQFFEKMKERKDIVISPDIYILAGDLYYKKDDFANAVGNYRRGFEDLSIIERDPKYMDSLKKYIVGSLRIEDIEEAKNLKIKAGEILGDRIFALPELDLIIEEEEKAREFYVRVNGEEVYRTKEPILEGEVRLVPLYEILQELEKNTNSSYSLFRIYYLGSDDRYLYEGDNPNLKKGTEFKIIFTEGSCDESGFFTIGDTLFRGVDEDFEEFFENLLVAPKLVDGNIYMDIRDIKEFIVDFSYVVEENGYVIQYTDPRVW